MCTLDHCPGSFHEDRVARIQTSNISHVSPTRQPVQHCHTMSGNEVCTGTAAVAVLTNTLTQCIVHCYNMLKHAHDSDRYTNCAERLLLKAFHSITS